MEGKRRLDQPSAAIAAWLSACAAKVDGAQAKWKVQACAARPPLSLLVHDRT